ncbi:MAG: hypothetical protein A2927_03125 [Candidatus Komeilibacteria bacterium RIFCSPLOWO2_01_FULL_45_10]|uniref:Ferredoxin n=2 Tax=Parcubacteria group TaxID=1794811 RepID=A0A1G1Y2P7_9BACT|nr:MAG: hypothetical protein A2840_02835 [Candidatus Buchananbacteria bacterium RIFCSPHIGHO2_01_FULL_47_11b]OGY90043.1 MAG: hypothetical protein A2927_03125 [Candidatus Komeilibacteria bacterium RIFCSPLOWO2_01_FULL_45_10]
MSQEWVITVDRQRCIGAATCAVLAPLTFHLDAEGKVVILASVDNDTRQQILTGAKSCPVDAISIYDKNGKKIYPTT